MAVLLPLCVTSVIFTANSDDDVRPTRKISTKLTKYRCVVHNHACFIWQQLHDAKQYVIKLSFFYKKNIKKKITIFIRAKSVQIPCSHVRCITHIFNNTTTV